MLPGPEAPIAVAFYVGVFLAVTAVVYRKRSRPDRETEGRLETEGRPIRDAVPRWQYAGRHVESGGITRDGQERALEEIKEQAGTLDRIRPDRGE